MYDKKYININSFKNMKKKYNGSKSYKEDFKQFKLCEEKLVIVHPYCNVMIAKVFRKLKK